MKVIGVNGIHSDGRQSTDLLLQNLAGKGWVTEDFNYPKVNVISARWKQHSVGKALAKVIDDGDAVIAHSFGCLATLRAMEQGAIPRRVYFFGPAVSDKITFPPGPDKIYVIYHLGDKMIWMGAHIAFHPFGRMGRRGYAGQYDERVHNVYAGDDSDLSFFGHSHFFTDFEELLRWSNLIDADLSHAMGITPRSSQ